MAVLQRIGRSLMLPVAVLPAAALLVRLGNTDMLGRESFPAFITKIAGFMAAGGNAILDNMPLLFAVGIAIGFAKKSDGSTALAAVVGYLVFRTSSPRSQTRTCRRWRRPSTARSSWWTRRWTPRCSAVW
jgi:PTS system N-acetylglucosamine-specific IIC component